MILVAIVDKAGGMLFNGRRQSQDRLLRERLLSLSASSKLWISPFSAAQFTEEAPHLVSDPQWLEKAGEEE